MPSPTANAPISFPATWDREFAYLTLQYKSGKRYLLNTTVGEARSRALTAIQRKGAAWIKVAIPNADNSKSRICIWSNGQWTVTIASLPKTKDQ